MRVTNVLKSTRGDQVSLAVPDFADSESSSALWDELRGTTLRLAALFWLSVIALDSIMWDLATNVDPLESLPGKLVTNSLGALMTVGISFVLFRVRKASLLVKTLLAFGMSGLAAPLYWFVDFQVYKFCIYPQEPVFDLRIFGFTLISSTAMFFGWSCLYVSLIYSFDVRDRERKLAAAREEALSAQMQALRYQINPHFLFNTLNSIAGLIEEGAATRAERMVLSLSVFLRSTLEMDPLHDVQLADELALQVEYLEIERERFSDRMQFTIDVDAAARQALVPSLILQPLVENALKHGVGRSAEPVMIRIAAEKRGDRLWIAVENGLGSDRSPKPGFGIGLNNVAQRMNARFGKYGSFSARLLAENVYRAEIEMPWRVA